MSAGHESGAVRVEARLELDIDGQRATITGDGGRLTVHSPTPTILLDAVSAAALPAGFASISGPRALGRLASTLAEVGLQVQVTGPGGPIVTMGDESSSVSGRLLTGSRYVRLGAFRAVLPLALHRVRAGRRPPTGGVVVAGVAAVLAVAAGQRLRRR